MTCPNSTTGSFATKPSCDALHHASHEKAEHMQGMEQVVSAMRQKPLQIYAYSIENAPIKSNHPLKTVHFVRHGQGFHNLMADLAREQGREWVQNVKSKDNPYTTPEIVDAPLTEKGRQQALLLQSHVEQLPQAPQLVVLSPNCRALQTGLLAFESLLPTAPGERGHAPFIAHEMVREEHGVHCCDQRRSVSRQSREFPFVDFSLLETDEDTLFQEDARETKVQVGERVYQFMEWLYERTEDHVAVSSHSAWLLTVFNGVCQSEENKLKEWFLTGEMRSVVLEFVIDQPPHSV